MIIWTVNTSVHEVMSGERNVSDLHGLFCSRIRFILPTFENVYHQLNAAMRRQVAVECE